MYNQEDAYNSNSIMDNSLNIHFNNILKNVQLSTDKT